MSETARLRTASGQDPSYNATTSGPPEAGDTAAQGVPLENQGRFFPFEPFWFVREILPHQYLYLPSYVRKVHSLPHMVLLTGIIANVLLVLQLVWYWKYWEDQRHGPWDYAVVIASCIFAIISFQLLHLELAQYRADLHTCSTEAQKSKDQMMNTFNSMVCDLDTMLSKSADTQASLAERSLDSHRRDLANFLLKGMSSRIGKMQDFPTLDFIAFLGQYLKIFEECSAYPVEQPFIIATKDELLERAATEVVEMVGKRAKSMEVKFVRNKVEGAKKSSSVLRQKWTKLMFFPKKVMKLTGISRFVKTKKKEEEATDELSMPKSFAPDVEQEVRWLQLESSCGWMVEVDEDETFPVQIKAGFISCTVLSPEHARLLFCCFIGIPLLAMNIMLVRPRCELVIASMLVTLICIAFVLHDFLDIDAVQRMEIQIKEMQAAVAAVEERRQVMTEFFSRVHQLSDFWLYRTLPRLELMKLCGDAVEDVEEKEMAPLLVEIVAKVGSLEDALLPVDFWQSEKLTEAEKRKTSECLSALTSKSGAKHALQELPKVTQDLLDLKTTNARGRAEAK